MASKQQHFLLLPYSEQGHINPMLSLASHLLRLGHLVTFVTAERRTAPAPQASASAALESKPPPCVKWEAPSSNESAAHERLRFVTLPVRNDAPCIDPKTMTRHQIFKITMAGLEDRQDLVAAIVAESKASPCPITCIISDWLLWRWARHIASAQGVAGAVFCIFAAFSFYIFYLDSMDKDEEIDKVLVSQYGMPSFKDAMTYLGLANMQDTPTTKLQKRKVFNSLFEGIEEAKTILVNSFEALEAPLVPSLEASRLNVKFIGPCLPGWQIDDLTLGNQLAQKAGSIFSTDEACLTWLNQQEKGSVLFVSFGSEAEMGSKQVEEIELGIEKSGHKFLWVVRPNALESSRPVHGLRERMNGQDKGMFVAWAPQIRVLQHLAIGGFLTHSGWNSTLESLTFGVPMLCLPMLGDHPFNANFVQHNLQVGIRLNTNKDGLVHREDVASGVEAIMKGQFSQKVEKVQELAQLAMDKVHHNLTSFVQALS